ncbi:MAG: hypothetical protein QXF12_08320 [Candidatus Aenigmatarchaeota archaeon]
MNKKITYIRDVLEYMSVKEHHIGKVILDIDDTLVDFSGKMYRNLKKYYPDIKFPYPSDWRWGTIKKIIGHKKFDEMIDITVEECNQSKPFPEVPEYTNILYELGYEIVILTHRSLSAYEGTKRFLLNNSIKYHELIVTHVPKIQFIDDNTVFIVDDAPHTLKDVKKYRPHVKLFARKMRYNKDIKGVIRINNLFDTLKHI